MASEDYPKTAWEFFIWTAVKMGYNEALQRRFLTLAFEDKNYELLYDVHRDGKTSRGIREFIEVLVKNIPSKKAKKLIKEGYVDRIKYLLGLNKDEEFQKDILTELYLGGYYYVLMDALIYLPNISVDLKRLFFHLFWKEGEYDFLLKIKEKSSEEVVEEINKVIKGEEGVELEELFEEYNDREIYAYILLLGRGKRVRRAIDLIIDYIYEEIAEALLQSGKLPRDTKEYLLKRLAEDENYEIDFLLRYEDERVITPRDFNSIIRTLWRKRRSETLKDLNKDINLFKRGVERRIEKRRE